MQEGGSAAMTVTKAMFSDLTSSITANAEVIVPIGVTIMGIMVGITLIPRILYKFI